MEGLLILVAVVGIGVLGAKVGPYLTLLSLVILTALWGLLLSAMLRETLAVVISLIWMVPSGAFVLGAWAGYLGGLKGAEQVGDKVFGLFIKDPNE